ncbi:SgcJ/EcaC family oxidoreductase [Hydromonas duriensis]|uniref:Uncharacterized protein (TIGR02246 family) n=1 Tax=Hydromonas duriensis TaxID=1527608 RepID=A0A4R6Y8S3_9BURK|nr:SgcJ/EcaC family oxidoreductase [Hydromonas duriensis]TDR31807.1 uncharacterized protein (TIGR02246 family) [Hydromonas duriensis]
MKTSIPKISRLLLASSFALVANVSFAQKAEQSYAPVAEACANTSTAEVRALFNRWNDSLQTHDAAKVTANYADDAVLLPTVSNKPRTNHDEIQDYFVHFLEKNPQGTINKSHVKIGCNKATDVGVYTFKLTDKAGNQNLVKARYSFVYEYKNGQWLISHHHSSMMPEVETTTHHK